MHLKALHSITEPLPTLEEVRADDRDMCRTMLHKMMRIGIHILEAMELHTVNDANDGRAPTPETALAYERVTRALRRSMLLNDKLLEPIPAPGPAPSPDPQPTPRERSEPSGNPPEHRPENPPADHPEDVEADRPEDDSITHLPVPAQLRAIRADLHQPRITTRSLLIQTEELSPPAHRARRKHPPALPKAPTFRATSAKLVDKHDYRSTYPIRRPTG